MPPLYLPARYALLSLEFSLLMTTVALALSYTVYYMLYVKIGLYWTSTFAPEDRGIARPC